MKEPDGRGRIYVRTVCSSEIVKCCGMNNTVAEKFQRARIAADHAMHIQLDGCASVGAP